jgi:hypothetical protein
MFGEQKAELIKGIQTQMGIDPTEFKKNKNTSSESSTESVKKVEVSHTVNATDAIAGFYKKEWTLNPERWVQGQGYLDPN